MLSPVSPSVCHIDGSDKEVEVRIEQISPYRGSFPLVIVE